MSQSRAAIGPAAARRVGRERQWLLFVHQLPAQPSNLRVRTWRRMQQIGAIPVKQAVYALPDTATCREDFEWLKTDVNGAGGDATVFVANNLDAPADDALIEEFRRARQTGYAALARDIERTLKRAGKPDRSRRAPALRRLIQIFGERLTALERIDFFASAGADRVRTLLKQLEARASDPHPAAAASSPTGAIDASALQQRLWVTRPRPGVDRMASAWLIQRFIDPKARFSFVVDRDALPRGGVPFDMFGVEFSHHQDGCTYETLCRVFALRDSALARIGAIVHDLDLKDDRFGAAECATVGAMIEGLQIAIADDHALLAQGITMFDSLYRSFERSARLSGPRRVVKPRKA
jgi:hypothetical protein